jgi:hypothetical protein
MAKQVLNKSKNEEEIGDLRGELKDAYERFMVCYDFFLRANDVSSHVLLQLASQIRNQRALAVLTAADENGKSPHILFDVPSIVDWHRKTRFPQAGLNGALRFAGFTVWLH